MTVNEHLRVAAIVKNTRGELLVVRHVSGGATFWTCPGGLLIVGESLSYALRRNVTSQTGQQIRIGSIACAGEVTIARTSRRRIEIYFYAEAAEPTVNGPVREGVTWRAPSQLIRDFLPSAVLAALGRSAHGDYLANMTDEDHVLPAPWSGSRKRFT